MAKASKVRERYLKVTGAVSTFLESVKSDPTYSWVAEANTKEVRELQTCLVSDLDNFQREFMSGASSQELKGLYEETH
eukprot:4617527-Alexandrium_andersonii.AAC.1